MNSVCSNNKFQLYKHHKGYPIVAVEIHKIKLSTHEKSSEYKLFMKNYKIELYASQRILFDFLLIKYNCSEIDFAHE